MAYYDALIAAWNAGSPPSGASGTAFAQGDTTAQKLVKINGWTITGQVPTSFYVTGNQLINCINYAEFKALTAAQQLNLLTLCAVPSNLLGGSGNTAFMVDGMILDYFTNHAGPTIAALTALAQATVTPWWQVPVAQGGAGLNTTISLSDLAAAGGLT